MRKTIIIIIGILVVLTGSLWYIFSLHSKRYTENSAFKAVSMQSPLIIEVPSLEKLLSTWNDEKSEVLSQVRSAEFLSDFSAQIDWLHAQLKNNEELRDFLDEKPILVSYNQQGKDAFIPLYSFGFEKALEVNSLLRSLKDYAQDNQLQHHKYSYDNHELHSVDFPIVGTHYYTCHDGIFTLSKSRILVENSIRQIDSSNLLQENHFKELYSTVSKNSVCNLFVNHAQIPIMLQKIINKEHRQTVHDVAHFAQWSECDVTKKNDRFWLNGYSAIDQKNDSYLSAFTRQKAQRFRFDQMISSNASMFLNFNFENFSLFQEDYTAFLKLNTKAHYQREARLVTLKRTYGKNILELFAQICDNDFALVLTSNAPDASRYFLVKTQSNSISRDELIPLIEKAAEIEREKEREKEKAAGRELKKEMEKEILDSFRSSYTLDENKSYEIYRFPIPDIAQLLLGDIFASATCNYLCFYDNYLLFADSKETMKSYIHDLTLRSTLSKDPNFKGFNREMSSNSNFYFYFNFSKFFPTLSQYFNSQSAKILSDNEASLRKFQAFGWQFSSVSDKFMNNIYFNFNPTLKEDPQALWASQLDAPVNIKPQLVNNHLQKDTREVIVQDNDNNLYLINKEGVQVWKIKLSGKIIGRIHQIDIYQNKRLQYVFNTAEKLYVLDRNGNNVSKFPVSLRANATNGVSVFDYDNNGRYRFFLACDNKQTYAYDKTGNIVTGWRAAKTDALVSNPIQYRRINNADYIFYTDLHNTYILSRTGESRNDKVERFEHSDNDIYLINTEGNAAIATTDTKGIIHMQYIDGAHKTVKFANFGSDHKFVASDINGDGSDDFIFAARNVLVAFDSSGKQLFETKFNSNISNTPVVFNFENNEVRIGVTTKEQNQIHLITLDGKEYDGFPLQGNTDFSISKFTNQQEHFNLLVGNNTGFLNYMVN